MNKTVFTSNDRAVAVLFDTEDSTLPIGIDIGSEREWLTEGEAESLAKEVLSSLSKPDASAEATSAVLASTVSFNEGLLRLAAIHGKTVTFRYAKGDGENIEQRSLKPSEIKEVKGKTLFIGFDPDRDEPRAYRVDRMKGEVSVA